MALNYCGVDGCRNPIKEGAAGCWRHPDGLSSKVGGTATLVTLNEQERKDAFDTGLGRYPDSIIIPNPTALDQAGVQVNLLLDHTKIAPDAAPVVVQSVNDMLDSGHQLEVPSYVAPRLTDLVAEFQSKLRSGGIKADRITTLKMTGMHRRTPKGLVQNAQGVSHLVTVIDKDSGNHQIAIDPFVSVMTPVRNRDLPISEQYGSASSPLADVPMISPIRDYVLGDYLWFDKFEWQG